MGLPNMSCLHPKLKIVKEGDKSKNKGFICSLSLPYLQGQLMGDKSGVNALHAIRVVWLTSAFVASAHGWQTSRMHCY